MKKLEQVQFCILGAGPTGLTFARKLKKSGVESFVVLEAEDVPGGLCRSIEVDGAPLDMGGGHFLDVRRKSVLDFLFELMPESEWRLFQRVATINLRGREISHPLEANLWQFDIEDQIDFIASVAMAGCVRNLEEPTFFSEWIRWKLGDLIAQEYMIPYNEKIWGISIDKIGTYWLHKLPSVSFRETLRSILTRKPAGALPAHGQFYYPKKYGYGEVWRRMGVELGDHLRLSCPVSSIDVKNRVINGSIKADYIINTIPWTVWMKIDALPSELSLYVKELFHISIDVDYYPENVDSSAHWIYEPSSEISYHRLLLRKNFCSQSQGHWVETNIHRSGPAGYYRHRNEYAYPVNTVNKKAVIDVILKWADANGIIPLGRWGLWEHMNSDVAVELSMKSAEDLIKKDLK